MKKWYESKTTWVNLGIAVMGSIGAWAADQPLDPTVVGLIVAVIGAANMYLRRLTGVPIEGSSAAQ